MCNGLIWDKRIKYMKISKYAAFRFHKIQTLATGSFDDQSTGWNSKKRFEFDIKGIPKEGTTHTFRIELSADELAALVKAAFTADRWETDG